MSTVKVNNLQVGQSGTATHNFTLTAANADGTAKLARGNVGATTQDVMTVASDGKVDFPAGLSAFLGSNQALGSSGYQKFPGGLILQWGAGFTTVDGTIPITFPVAFPNACVGIHGTHSGAGPALMIEIYGTRTKTGVLTKTYNADNQVQAGWAVLWFAIGY